MNYSNINDFISLLNNHFPFNRFTFVTENKEQIPILEVLLDNIKNILTQQDIFLPPKNIVDYTYGMLKFYESSTLMVATYRCKVRRRKSNIKEIAVSNGLKTQ